MKQHLLYNKLHDKYQVHEFEEKPVFGRLSPYELVASEGEMVFQFDPGYVVTDIVEVKKIVCFDELNGIARYHLQDQNGEIEMVRSGLVTPIHPWLQWLYKLGFSLRTRLAKANML